MEKEWELTMMESVFKWTVLKDVINVIGMDLFIIWYVLLVAKDLD